MLPFPYPSYIMFQYQWLYTHQISGQISHSNVSYEEKCNVYNTQLYVCHCISLPKRWSDRVYRSEFGVFGGFSTLKRYSYHVLLQTNEIHLAIYPGINLVSNVIEIKLILIFMLTCISYENFDSGEKISNLAQLIVPNLLFQP